MNPRPSPTLRKAYDEFKGSIDDIEGSESLAEAAATVLVARDTFVTQWEAIRSNNGGGANLPTTTI